MGHGSDNNYLAKWLESSTEYLVIVVFYAPWLGAYELLNNTLNKMAGDYPRIKIERVNIEVNPDLGAKMNVSSVPTTFIIHDREIVDMFVGVTSRKKLANRIKPHFGGKDFF